MVTLPFHPLEVREGEHKVYRLFAIDLATHDIPAFTRQKLNTIGDDDYPLRDALGVPHLDEQHVQILALSDLGELGLTGYMREGLGIETADLQANAARLDALEGHVAVVASAAFIGDAVITPKPPVSLVGAYAEHEQMPGFVDLSSKSATDMIDLREDSTATGKEGWGWRHWILPGLGLLLVAYGLYKFFFAGGAS